MEKLLFFVLISFLLPGYPLYAQQKLSVDKTRILIGEPVTLTLEANFRNSASVAFFQLDSLPHFEILERSPIDTVRNNSSIRLLQRMVVTSWDSGRWNIPALTSPGTRGRTRPVTVEVVFSSFNPDQEYHDVKDILPVQKEKRPRWYWYVIGIALLTALFILLFPRRKKNALDGGSGINAYKVAIAELQQLKKDQGKKEVKEYYITLIQIFRKYLHQKKGIASYSKTTNDLVLPIEGLKLPAPLSRDLLQTLRLSDAVKFAKFQPDTNENNAAMDVIKRSIETIENV